MSNVSDIPYGWRMEKLGNLLVKIVGGGTPSRDKESFWNGGIPWATVKDLRKSILHSTEESITADALKESASNLIPKNTLIVATRMALGKVVFFTQDVAINQDLKALFPTEELKREFLFHWLLHQAEAIERLGSGSTVKGIRLEVLKGLELALPPLAEQQKIAEILSTVDEKMAVIDEQLAKTTELKTGLMQRLLTKGIGHTTFKDSPLGEIPESWKVVQLADVLKLIERPIKMNDEEQYELVTVKRRFGSLVPRGTYLGKEIKVKSQFIVRENDFVISKRQIVHCACGLVPAELDGAIVSNEYSVFNASSDLDLAFFNYYVQRPDIQKSFLLSSDGVHIEKMLFKVRDWLRTEALIPPLTEQRQISELLTTVDEKIQVLRDKKEHYQTLKRGLMQQLLTGKLRVRVTEDAIPA